MSSSVGSARTLLLVLGLSLLGTGVGCHTIGNPSRRMIPAWYRGNPWGLEANHKRASGEFSKVEITPKIALWDAWGRSHLQSGDVVFRMGDARAVFGLFRFSLLTADLGSSLFSHTGIVAREGDELVVYDISSKGPSRAPFGIWMLDVVGAFGVKRPLPEYQSHSLQAVSFCQSTYLHQTPYDMAMAPGDDQLYCVEMTELAYRKAGLPLSAAVPIDELPRYLQHETMATAVQLVSKIKKSYPVYMPGNDQFGLWSSPALSQVYYAPDVAEPRPDGLALRPYGPGYR